MADTELRLPHWNRVIRHLENIIADKEQAARDRVSAAREIVHVTEMAVNLRDHPPGPPGEQAGSDPWEDPKGDDAEPDP